MKKLGIVGGMGPETTISYYHDIVYGVQEKLGYPCSPPVVIESLDLFHWVGFLDRNDYPGLIEETSAAVERLAAAGADFAVLGANTAHIIFDEVQKRSPIPLLSMITAACDHAVEQGYKRVGLVGTGFTMDSGLFTAPMEKRGIEVIVPHGDERAYIHEKIYSDLVNEIVTPEVAGRFMEIAQRMRDEDGIEALILGCTEMPLVFTGECGTVPYINTLQIHIKRIISEIIRG